MYSTANEAIIAQHMSSPLDEQIARVTRRRPRRGLTTTYRPANNRGGQL